MLSSLFLFGAKLQGLDDNLPKVDASHSNISVIFNTLYLIAGLLAVIFIIIGGIQYSLSGGDSSKIAKGKNTILYAVAGLVIALLAFAITNFLLGNIKVNTWQDLRDSVINTLIFIAGAVAVVMIIFGGFRYVTSNGNASSVTAAKNTIVYAVIGLIIAVLAYTIVNFVLGKL